ncbi:MAG TPA: hypothetical protein VFR37_15455 [Longimicrobium sp.]|nr:hypothetical protein [Longimicrobium sp.]
MTVGLTGLMLMLPVRNPVGATELFMPTVGNHVAYVGFRWANKVDCDEYNDDFGICFMKLEKSYLEPIGVATTTQSTAPASAVSVTRTSGGKKGQVQRIDARSRSRATLLSGTGKNPCALGRWTIDPYGPEHPQETIDPANVLTWEIPNVPGEEIALARRSRPGGSLPNRDFTLRANQGRIELLIVHVPWEEFQELLNAKPGPGEHSPRNPDLGEINRHLNWFYEAIEVPAGQRAWVTNVDRKDPSCSIPVLGLQNAKYPLYDAVNKRFRRQTRDGIRTYSCVIASAEEG